MSHHAFEMGDVLQVDILLEERIFALPFARSASIHRVT